MNRRAWLVALCVVPWALTLAGLSWLLIKRIPPAGVVTFTVPFDGTSAWIDPFLPGERVTSPGVQEGGTWSGQRIFADPVYASARIPGVYDRVDVTLDFRPLRQPLVEFGLARNIERGEIEFSPLWFAPLQDSSWEERRGVGFEQRGTKPDDVSAHALWRATSSVPLLSDPAGQFRTTRVTLRGGLDVYAVPAAGTLKFTFAFQDVNRSSGSETVVIRVFRGEQEIQREAVGVGGSQDVRMGTIFEKTVEFSSLAPGVYHIQVIDDDDVFIRSIGTNATRWVVGPRLVFADDVGFATSTQPGHAWTDSRHIVAETFHKEGLQTLTVGADQVALTRTHTVFPLDRTDHAIGIARVDAPHGDVRLVGDGWFALSPDAWFAPQPRRLTDATQPEVEGITSIATPYQRPEALGDGWYRGHASFALDPAQDRIRFVLGAPGMASRNGSVDIRQVTLTYRRPPLSFHEWWRVMRTEFVNAWRRLRS